MNKIDLPKQHPKMQKSLTAHKEFTAYELLLHFLVSNNLKLITLTNFSWKETGTTSAPDLKRLPNLSWPWSELPLLQLLFIACYFVLLYWEYEESGFISSTSWKAAETACWHPILFFHLKMLFPPLPGMLPAHLRSSSQCCTGRLLQMLDSHQPLPHKVSVSPFLQAVENPVIAALCYLIYLMCNLMSVRHPAHPCIRDRPVHSNL